MIDFLYAYLNDKSTAIQQKKEEEEDKSTVKRLSSLDHKIMYTWNGKSKWQNIQYHTALKNGKSNWQKNQSGGEMIIKREGSMLIFFYLFK